MSPTGSVPPRFIGIDPDGLCDLARLVESRATHLRVQAAQTTDVAAATATPALEQVADRLQRTAADLAAWSRGVEPRVVAIQDIRRAATTVLSQLVDRVIAGAANMADGRTLRPSHEIDLAEVYRQADTVLLGGGVSGAAEERRLSAFVGDLDGSDVVQLADMLIGGGHDISAVAAIGEAAGTLSWGVVRAVLERLEERLEYGELVGSVLAGSLVAGSRGEIRPRIAHWLAARPALVSVVMYGAAIADEGRGRPNESLDQIADVLAQLDDVEQIADVVVELITAQRGRTPAPDLVQLDEAISMLIGLAPRAVMTQLAVVTDRDGAAMVPWMRRLVGVDHGPDAVGRIVADVAGVHQLDPSWFSDPGPGRRFENAATAAYLSTSLSLAVQKEADAATRGIAGIAAAAGLTEILVPGLGRAVRAVEVLVPTGLTIGVGSAARAADRRVDDSMDALLERIAERFELPADAAFPELALALSVFDERRDALVEHWEGRR